MTDDDFWDDDPFLNESPAEPVCYTCNDHGGVPAGRLTRLVRRRHVAPCPDCNATRLTYRYRRLLWHLRNLRWRLRHPSTDPTNEPPF